MLQQETDDRPLTVVCQSLIPAHLNMGREFNTRLSPCILIALAFITWTENTTSSKHEFLVKQLGSQAGMLP